MTDEPELLVLDTSFFVASEDGRPLRTLPPDVPTAVTVITLAELHLGVLNAADTDTRLARLRTLLRAQEFEVLVADEQAAERFAGIVMTGREQGLRVGVHDAWIAAIAASKGAAVATQDSDFDPLPVETYPL